MLHGHEPLAFKGGILTAAYKGKGPVENCSSFRSLLISNHLGKAVHRSIRQKTANIYEKFLHKQQTGGRRGIPVQLAMHQTRAFCRHAKHHGLSTGLLFVDLQEAFYRVLREVPLGGCVGDELLAHLMVRLKMPDDALHQIHDLLSETPAVVQAGLSPMYQRSFRAIHQSTHFWMRGQGDVSRTTMGTRPGDSFADIVFGYMWRSVLAKLEQYLIDHNMIQPIDAHLQLPLFGHCFPADCPSYFVGPTWMDDLAICISVTEASQLPATMAQVACFLLDLCRHHCLSPNLSPGKTELLLSFRGAGSRQLKTQYYGPESTGCLPIIGERGCQQLRLVTCYKHLGGLCHHSSDQRAELRQRAAVAHQAMSQHRKLLYHNRDVPVEKRRELFQALVLTKFLYGADSWIALDNRTHQHYHSKIIGLYKRLAQLPTDQHHTDDAVLAAVQLPSPCELLRRARLRYLTTLIKADHADAWTLLAKDRDWCQLLEEDMIWMWQNLRYASVLKDPRVHYLQWLQFMQMHPRYWKRLIGRACEHSVRQRQRRQQVIDLHCRALQAFNHFQPGIADGEPVPHEAEGVFGCMACKIRCRSRAGEEAHMFKKHQHTSPLRTLCDHPTCPSCLKFFHTMQKLKAHLHYSVKCRTVLQSRNIHCPIIPGSGSADDALRTSRHDRLLPPLVCMGPQQQATRRRQKPDIDGKLYDFLVDATADATDTDQYYLTVKNFVGDCTISWTRLRRTLDFFAETLMPEDAQVLHFAPECAIRVLRRLATVEEWPFLRCDISAQVEKYDIKELEKRCNNFCWDPSEQTDVPVHKPVGRFRILLHLFSGRRRRGDVQYYLDGLAKEQTAFTLMVISLDIVIDPVLGDATNRHTCEYWLDAIRKGYVIAMLAGPPCESWSKARSVPLTSEEPAPGVASTRGPRIIRDIDNLWGMESVTLRELQQLFVGNALLAFALLALMELAIAGGHGMIEHPAEPDEQCAASIWRLPLVRAILRLPHTELLRFSQGLMGAKSSKPTHLLLLNLPQFVFCLHANRVRTEIPRTTTIGKDQSGQWQTAALKEYPPAFCKAISHAFYQVIQDRPICTDMPDQPAEFLNTCKGLVASAFGDNMGPDFARG